MEPLQRLPHGGSDIESDHPFFRTLFTNLSLSKLVARFLRIARHQVTRYFRRPIFHLGNLQGFVFDMDSVTLQSGAPVTRILATCTPNIVQVVQIKFQKPWRETSGGTIDRRNATCPDQDLLPGWLWAPMDTTTELPELPFRPWNTSIPICGKSHNACPDDSLVPCFKYFRIKQTFFTVKVSMKICCLYTYYMPVICLLYACYMPVIFLLYAL